MRQDFLHKLSTRLVRENQAIIVETLNVKGLAQTRLAKSVYDAGWSEFLRQLEYKCRWAGKSFCKIDQFFPSTKTCHHCGTRNDVSLSDREFICQGCGRLIDRDYNAAQNIKHRGFLDLNVAAGQTETSNARGVKVRPVASGASL
jgi:putative transposase